MTAAATPEQRLAALGVELPPPFADDANRVRALRSGNLVFMSGHGPLGPGNVPYVTGKLGRELTVPQGYDAARLAGLCTLSTLRRYLGSLDHVTRVVRVQGFINCAPGFTTPSDVLHGFSDLMVEVFGDAGKHSRAAMGSPSLPRNVTVEVAAVIETA